MFQPVRRATLTYPSGPPTDIHRHHLFILLTDPHGPAEQVLMVSCCSVPANNPCDTTTILAVGDHEFIKHASYVAFAKCRTEPASKLIAGVASGQFVDKGLCSEEVFAKIIAGLYASDYVKPFATEFYEAAQRG
jgi:hypothetical protein